MKKRIFSPVVALAILAPSFSTTIHAADDEKNVQALNPRYTYKNNGYTLEKVSHADVESGRMTVSWTITSTLTRPERPAPALSSISVPILSPRGAIPRRSLRNRVNTEEKYPDADDSEINRMVSESAGSLTGDACRSYAFSALGYGDWVYIGTMYGGTGITKHNAETMLNSIGLLKDEIEGTDEEKAEAKKYNDMMVDSAVGLLYDDNYYTEHPVRTQAMLFKMNVKTGETKIIMAGSVNGYQVTLRNAVGYNKRFYFIGTQVGTESVADAAVFRRSLR